MKIVHPDLQEILHVLYRRQLGVALQQLDRFLAQRQTIGADERLHTIRQDYEAMKAFMLRGLRDAKRDEVYQGLLQTAYRLTMDVNLWLHQRQAGAFARAFDRSAHQGFSADSIRLQLESFVQEVALLSLQPDEARERQLYDGHQRYISALFDYLLCSSQWTDGMRSSMTDLVLLPTIDVNDACLLVSAVTLSCVNGFDVNKFLFLAKVYMETGEEMIRQRALVGWAFALDADAVSLFPQVEEMIVRLMAVEGTDSQLLQLQQQVFYCLNADRDTATISRDIMPTLMKHNGFTITSEGIKEKEEDIMQDILHPEADEEAMEEVENSIQRMKEMQEKGSDIYFGGFSQMKRFSFFYTLSNWFVPFYERHPALREMRSKLGNDRFLNMLFASGPFCDSDKYSFALAMVHVIDKLPANVREMMGNSETLGMAVSEEDMLSPAYIRRLYLQDLYRFFRLYSLRADFENPFEEPVSHLGHFFFAHPVLLHQGLLVKAPALLRFLFKQKMWSFATTLLDNIPDTDDPSLLLMQASMAHRQGLYDVSAAYYRRVLSQNPGHERAKRGLASSLFNADRYEEAARLYAELVQTQADNLSLRLHYGLSLLNAERVDEAVALFFQLDYEHPEVRDVSRSLAWALMMAGKLEQAEKQYGRLQGSDNPADLLNAGYCQWFLGRIEVARDLFRRYLSVVNAVQEVSNRTKLNEEFGHDNRLLVRNHISSVEQSIMLDLVTD